MPDKKEKEQQEEIKIGAVKKSYQRNCLYGKKAQGLFAAWARFSLIVIWAICVE